MSTPGSSLRQSRSIPATHAAWGGIVLALAVALVTLGHVGLNASSSRFFRTATQADFLKGDADNLSIDDQGRLVLGPASELIFDTSAPFLWSVVAGSDGSLFVGTGNDGKVFKIDAQGRGSLFFDPAELEAHALAPAPDGGLYVATSPDGRIYKVDRNGKESVFFDPDDKYIWSLAVDGSGNLYAGTGPKGVVYKITPDGKGTAFCEIKASHATALAFDRKGDLYVGSGTPGRVLRVDSKGKVFVLLDSGYDEVHALHFDGSGTLFATALSGRSPLGGAAPSVDDRPVPATNEPTRAPVPTVTTEITAIAIGDVSATAVGTGTPREGRRQTRGAIFRIAPDGLWDRFWDAHDDAPYDLAVEPNGALLVGTGNKGKIYRLEGDPVRATLVTRAGSQQVTTFYRDGRGRLYFAAANPGKLYRLSAERASRGTYESEPLDAQIVSTWGAISWEGSAGSGSRTEISTRSGNTATPDDTWSTWSDPYQVSQGSTITSPKGRYLQWRAVLTGQGDGPVLTSLSAAYLQRNLRPQVMSITLHPPGIVFQKPFSTGEPDLAGFDDQTTPDRKLTSAAMSGPGSSNQLGRRTYAKGLQTIGWKADDENEDDLIFDVFYRREGEAAWTTMRRAMVDPILVWDTTTVPNGTYFIRVVASDSPSNPSGLALNGELDSGPLEVDNTPPTITVRSVKFEAGRTTIVFDVTDDHSPIQRAEFSLDGQRWRNVFPTDGAADSKSEHYQLVLDGALTDRGVVLRASDAMNNVGTGYVSRPSQR